MGLDPRFLTSLNKFWHSPTDRAEANSLTSPECDVAPESTTCQHRVYSVSSTRGVLVPVPHSHRACAASLCQLLGDTDGQAQPQLRLVC